MLWRANEYIDEARNEDGTFNGTADWNDLNPWTSAQGNEWDINYPVLSASDPDYIRQNHVDGGQFNIKPWTRPYDVNNLEFFPQNQTTVFNAVAYSGGCADTIMDFNVDLDFQSDALTASGQPTGRVNKTLAPGLDWDGYISGNLVAGSNPADWTAPVIAKQTRYPYRPVLTSVVVRNYNGVVLGYGTNQLGYSSGVDCYGHLQRVASYNGNPYRLRDFSAAENGGDGNRLEWGQDNANLYESLVGIKADSWLIEGLTTANINNQDGPRNLIVPGDIITMDGHVAVISKVEFNAGTRVINPTLVTVIECTSPLGEWKVLSRSNRHLRFFAINPGFFPNLTIRRLVIE